MKNKVRNKILLIVLIVIILFVIPMTIFAYSGLNTDIVIGENGSDALKSSESIINRVVGILQLVGTIISVIALIIIGMRYMFSSLEERAKMKGVIWYYIIGCVLVCATSNIVALVYNVLDETQHNYVDVTGTAGIKLSATCVSEGIGIRKCTDCGKEVEKTIPIKGDEHSMGEWIYTEETCTTDGKRKRECTYRCGYYEETVVPKLGHKFELTTIQSPTCTENGYQANKCKRLGCGFEKDKTIIAATGHSETYNMRITKEATCTESGIERYSCQNGCGDYYEKTISPYDHKYTTVTVTATCTVPGGSYEKCVYCEEKKNITQTAALGHNWGTAVHIQNATCTTQPIQRRTCVNGCGQVKDEYYGSALGHSYGPTWHTHNDGTRTHTTGKTCTRCYYVNGYTEACSGTWYTTKLVCDLCGGFSWWWD